MSLIEQFIESKRHVLKDIDEQNLYVENIMELLNLPRPVANALLKNAAHAGLIERWVGFTHPEHDYIIHQCREDSSPEGPFEDIQSIMAEAEKTEFYPDEMGEIRFYRIPKR